MQFDGVRGEVADEYGEHLVEHVLVQVRQARLFQDQLTVDDQGEQPADGEEQIEIAALLLVGAAVATNSHRASTTCSRKHPALGRWA